VHATLPTAHYTVPTGEDKEVHYWAARVSDKTLAKSNFKPSEEVAKVDWVTPEKAHELLSYKFDNEVLNALLDLEKKHQLKTNSLIVLRHAKAMTRDEWHKGYIVDDGKRPLLDEGTKQAKKLIPLLAAFGPKLVTSSPWVRCFNTVQPYAKKMNLPIIERSQLSENGNKKGPKRTRNVVKDIIDEGKSAVLCSHRPALPTILSELAHLASKEQAKEIEAAADLKACRVCCLASCCKPRQKTQKSSCR
jgi:8-oxo-(d)GTP phosphatase